VDGGERTINNDGLRMVGKEGNVGVWVVVKKAYDGL